MIEVQQHRPWTEPRFLSFLGPQQAPVEVLERGPVQKIAASYHQLFYFWKRCFTFHTQRSVKEYPVSSETLSIATEFVQTSVTHYLYYMQATHNDFDDVDEESAALTPELSEHFILFGHQRSAMVQTWLRDPKPSVVAF
ncbi:MAG: hypothetical protein AAFS10_27065, partial [Myxococcota bacterium]